MRKDSLLENRSETDQAFILHCLDNMTYQDAIVLLAKPPPEGLFLSVSRSTLNRFYMNARSPERAQDREQILAHAKILTQQALDPDTLEEAALDQIRTRFFNASFSPEASVCELQRLFTILLKVKANSRQERKARLTDVDLDPPDLFPEMINAMDIIYGPENKPGVPGVTPTPRQSSPNP